MKTAQEVLAEDTLSRLHREAEERRLAALVSRVRRPRGQIPFVAQLVSCAAAIVMFVILGNQTGDYRGVYVVCGMFFAFVVPSAAFFVNAAVWVSASVIFRFSV